MNTNKINSRPENSSCADDIQFNLHALKRAFMAGVSCKETPQNRWDLFANQYGFIDNSLPINYYTN